MNNMNKTKLHDVLMSTERLHWRDALYLPKEKNLWSKDCEAIIANPDLFEEYDNDDNPVELSKIGYRYVLLCDDLASVASNLREQGVEPTLDLMYDAFIFYLNNDAFLKI